MRQDDGVAVERRAVALEALDLRVAGNREGPQALVDRDPARWRKRRQDPVGRDDRDVLCARTHERRDGPCGPVAAADDRRPGGAHAPLLRKLARHRSREDARRPRADEAQLRSPQRPGPRRDDERVRRDLDQARRTHGQEHGPVPADRRRLVVGSLHGPSVDDDRASSARELTGARHAGLPGADDRNDASHAPR